MNEMLIFFEIDLVFNGKISIGQSTSETPQLIWCFAAPQYLFNVLKILEY